MRSASLALAACLCAAALAAQSEFVPIGHFSLARPGAPLPEGWTAYGLANVKRQTRYGLVELDGRTVLQADADASAAGLIFALRADPGATPWLEWSWRAENVIEQADIRTRQGDDYAGRIYVLFDYDLRRLSFADAAKIRLARLLHGADVPAAALCYVWDNRNPVGTSVWSAYTDRLRMIVAESGSVHTKRWVSARRNVAEDFRAAFGEDAPPIRAIVVASDTDNTGAKVRTYFGDISLRGAVSQIR
jgi:hypothetical protein